MPNVLSSSDPEYRGMSDIAELKEEIGEIAQYKDDYRIKYGSETLLTDDQIVLMVANSDDDDDPDGWATTMRMIEQEITAPTAA